MHITHFYSEYTDYCAFIRGALEQRSASWVTYIDLFSSKHGELLLTFFNNLHALKLHLLWSIPTRDALGLLVFFLSEDAQLSAENRSTLDVTCFEVCSYLTTASTVYHYLQSSDLTGQEKGQESSELPVSIHRILSRNLPTHQIYPTDWEATPILEI